VVPDGRTVRPCVQNRQGLIAPADPFAGSERGLDPRLVFYQGHAVDGVDSSDCRS
jgi:hypothetical protein